MSNLIIIIYLFVLINYCLVWYGCCSVAYPTYLSNRCTVELSVLTFIYCWRGSSNWGGINCPYSKKHKHKAVEINLTIGCVLEKAKVPCQKMALRSHVKLPASWDNLLELVNHNCNYLHCVNKAQRTNKLHHSLNMIRSSHSQES